MESEKVKEIKETLRRCGSGKVGCCWGCSLQDNQNVAKCTTILCEKALTLINHQDFQISTLKVQVANLEKELKKEQTNHLYYRQDSQFKESRIAELETLCNKTYEDLTKEIDSLENTIKNNLQYTKGYGDGVKATVEVAFPKKLNEFAERLKEKVVDKSENYVNQVLMATDIDETLKEFIND